MGAGPVGLFTVFACGMVGLRVCVLDALHHIGGQCSALYPKKPIYDIPGYPSILAGELVESLARQMSPFKPDIFLNTPTGRLEQSVHGWHMYTPQGTLNGRVIFLCTGPGAFTPKRPSIPGIQEFEPENVLYRIDDPSKFFGKHVVIAGGGDSAVDWSLLLCEQGAHVSLVHRRDTFRAQESSLIRLQNYLTTGKIKLFTPYQVMELKGMKGYLDKVRLQNDTRNSQWIPCDILVPCFGLEVQKSPFESWGIAMEAGMIITQPTTSQTSNSSIYAAGDCVTYPEKLKLIMTGFTEAVQGAHHLRRTHFSERTYRFEHSTSVGVPNMSQ
ncbi:Ferredoxin--NADP reductase [Holospora curviuscula]|uniref:Ferredoxin--NADP reductase n=1 Tax=Holospora curviuscula TaxID=1082868 RepID=A0A2S5RAE2_9PROT|nr:Ferredoxin--NADP reductase [Holospora curviuscula]